MTGFSKPHLLPLSLAFSAMLGCFSASATPWTEGSPRFEDNGDGTVTDHKLQLVWQRCNAGQYWHEGRCDGKAKRFSWRDAIQLELDGWRLPSIEELNSLVVCQNEPQNQISAQMCAEQQDGPTIDIKTFPNTPEYMYWSATGYKGNHLLAWGLHFDDGHVYASGINYRFYVRLVRKVPAGS